MKKKKSAPRLTHNLDSSCHPALQAQSAAEAPAPREEASTSGSVPAVQSQDVPATPQALPAAACGLSNPGHSLLQWLGLPEGAFRNIVMNRDIVPRAFACDYTLVADLLRRVGGGFKEHPCLSGPDRWGGPLSSSECEQLCAAPVGGLLLGWAELHTLRGPLKLFHPVHGAGDCMEGLWRSATLQQVEPALVLCCRVVMYFFVGKMLVLQPDIEHNFVRPGEEYHPMMPSGPGLYTLRTPTALDAMAATAKKEVCVSVFSSVAARKTCLGVECMAAQVQLAARPA